MTLLAAPLASAFTPPAVAEVAAPRIRGVGVLTAWGEGLAAIPADPEDVRAALLTVATPTLSGERFRRATRECLLAVAAVRAAAADGALAESELAGSRTGVVYASATAYAAANRAFLEDETSTTLHFPYTAPSAVPGEVTIAFGIRGPYVNLIGGGPAALQALWYAAGWLVDGSADRVLVLAVETVHEVWDLVARARRLYDRPLLEGAACLLLEPGGPDTLRWASAAGNGSAGPRRRAVARAVVEGVLGGHWAVAVAASAPRAARLTDAALAGRDVPAAAALPGEAMACGPLIGLGRARASRAPGPSLIPAAWRNDYAAMLWPRFMA
jgi:hypothetical protein